MAGSGFYKGEKKKSKKGKDGKELFSNAPVFVMPEIIAKKKKEQ